MRLDILGVYQGTKLGLDTTYIFMILRLIARSDGSILSITPSISIEREEKPCELLTNLSDWILVKDIPSKYSVTDRNTEDVNLEEVSLWKERTDKPLVSKIHQSGWIGLKVDGYFSNKVIELVDRLRLEVEDGSGKTHTFLNGPPWSQLEGQKIVSRALRQGIRQQRG